MALACVLALLAALLAAAPAFAQTDVWTATLTPADFSGTLGCNNASATSKCSTAATNALTLVVGSTSLAFADATTQAAGTRTWFNPGFSWTVGTAVSIRITGPTPIVPPDWSLKPTGLAQGSQFRLRFLSSTKRDASSTDIADYNTFVQDRAEAGHADIQAYSGGFGAIGCTAAVDARDNTSTTGTGVPIYWLDGTKVADDYADFYDGSWDDEINDKNESGTDAHDTSQAANYPFTGCKNDGTEEFAGPTSRGLGDAVEGHVRIGRLNSSGTLQDPLDGNDVAGTAATRPMYGLSAVFEVSSSPSTNPSVPAAISDVAVVPEPRTTDSLRVSWTAPDNTGKPALTGYDLRYKGTASDAEWVLVSHAGTGTSGTLTGLDEDTDYFVEVRALNAEYSGPWSVTAEGATTPVPEVVLANHPLVPADLGPGDSFRLLHVTSDTTAATGTGIHDYNNLAGRDIVRIAFTGNLLDRWFEGARLWNRALVSTPGADARLHTDTTWTGTDRGVPIYWVNGARVADDYQDFYDGAWADEANPMNGFGEPRSLAGAAPWTGSGNDGTELFEGTVSRAMGQASVGVGAPDSAVPGAGPLKGGAAFASTEERPFYTLWHVMVIDENFRLAGNLSLAFNATENSDERAAVRAQPFTTGSHPGGYGISEILVWRGSSDPADASLGDVALYTTDAQGDPDLADGLHATLSLESTDLRSWHLEAPEGTVLEASTTYALVFEGKAGAYPKLATSSADGEDAVVEGWSIADVLRYHDGSNWVDNPNGYALTMDIKGPLAAATTEVPSNWGLTPTGLAVGDRFRLLFLSSTKRDGTSTDIADYNTFVQTRAAAGHTDIQAYSAGFTAVGCTAAVDARDNTATTYTNTAKGVPIYWLGGAKAADEYEDFYDGSWDDEANDKNESGADGPDTSQAANYPWTGCAHNGTEAVVISTSFALGTSESIGSGVGRPNSSTAANGPLGSDDNAVNTATRPMYGLSAVFEVSSSPSTNPNVPAAISDLAAVPEPRTPGSLQVFWSAPDNAGKPALTGYDVRYSESGENNWRTVRVDDAASTTLIIGGLPNSYFDVQVRALNVDGAGPWSSIAEGATIFPPERVYANHPLIPDDLGPGDSFRLLFITEETTDATDTGIHDYLNFAADGLNEIVATGRLMHEWGATTLGQTALVSTPGADARQHNDTTWTETDRGVPIYWLNGARVADDYADFYDGVWADEANPTNDVGEPHSLADPAPWTGTDHDGTELFDGAASRAVGQSTVGVGAPGSSASGAGPLKGGTWFAKTEERPLYGLWHLLVVDENLRLVTNLNQPGATSSDSRDAVRAQLFTTGPHSSGYGIARIMVDRGSETDDFLGTVAIHTTDGDGDPDLADGLHATLSLERTREFSWDITAPQGTVLKPNTTYALVFKGDSGTYPELWTLGADGEDVPADGWSLADALVYYSGSAWEENSNGNSLVIEMTGPLAAGAANTPATGAPTITGTPTVGQTLTAATTAIMDDDGLTTPGYTYQWIRVATDNTETNIGSATASTYTLVTDDLGTTIKVKVSFTDDASNAETLTSVATAAVSAPTAPGAPTGLTATASGTTRIDLSWTAPAITGGSPITGYKIEESPNGTDTWTTHLADTTDANTTYAHTGLAASTTRHYRVSAINTIGTGAPSNVDDATTGTTVPDAPTSLAATASGNTRIDLTWTAPAITGGSPITGYKIEESPNGNSNWTTLEADTNGPATTYSHTGLSAGTTRHYRVSAINTNVAGAPSNVDGATTGTTVPDAPTVLTATASGTTRINLSWTAPASDGGTPITGYRIEESPDGNSNWTVLVATTGGASTTHSDTGLPGGTTRHYRVSAINSNGAGAPSSVDSATTGTSVPGAPTALSARASGTTQVDLSWTAPASDGGSPITGYKIEESPNGRSSWTVLVATTGSPATTYSRAGLASGATRHYRVSAVNTNGAGAPSNVDDATTGTTVPDAPTSLAATASGTTRINLSWTAPGSDGGSPITGYRIEESPNGNSSWTTLEADTNGPATTYSHTGLSGGTTRHYRVSAINSNGAGAPSNVDGATTGTTVPDAPTVLTATASGTTRINLSWTAPASDGGTPITGYRIEESPDGNSNWTVLVATTGGASTTHSDTGLPGGTTRHYRVSAINSNGAGAPSSVDSATTGTTVPGAPTALSARASGTTQVDLSWTAPASDGGSPITGYKIEESPNDRSSWTVLVATTGSPATTYSRAGLASGATRHYRVSAVNTNGAGAPSNTASTTTGTTVPGAPTRLTAAASGTARINLSWTAPGSDGGIRITGYRIESSLGSGSSWTDVVANTGTTGTTYSDTGLSGGTTRYYRVSAINTNGAGAPSNVDGATTGTTVPDAPTDLTARVSENTRINLSWARPASDGGSPVTGYRIEISSDGGSSWTDRVANTRSPHRAYSHIVAAGATRHYRVSAISAKGTSAHSNVASATTVLRTVRFEADLYRAREADYSGVPAGVTFAAGQARQTFTVTVTEDSDEDGLKRLRLQFGTLPSGYASRPPRTAVVRLVDNDGGLLVDFGTERHTTVRVREHADVRHRFSVYLRTNRYGPPNNNRQPPLTIPLVVQHVGGAEEDVDYTPRIPASVTFAAGQSQASFSIRAIPDGERETGEGLRIDFGPLPSGVARGEWGPYETIEFLDAGAPASANLSVAGPLLTLGYPGALDGGSTPSPRDFVVSAEAPGGEKAMAPVAAVSVRGSAVFLQLARPVLPDETVTLSYLADAMHPIREAAGLPAPPLTDAPVRNDTPASGPGPEAGLPVQAAIPAAMAVLPEEAPVGAQTQRLDLSSRNLTDLSALAGLTGLRELDLRDNAVEDLWPLAGLTGLRVLHLSGNRIADLSPLAGLTALEQLSLAGNRIEDLAPLTGLAGLRALDLSGNRIEDFWPLAGLAALERLNLADNRVADLATLAQLTGLRELDLAGNRIEAIWPLAGLAALERLNLSDNRIEDLWPLAGLSDLQVLLLDRNRITDLSALSPLAELANLGLSGNRIVDIGLLSELGRLRRLDLSGNAVANLSALGDLPGLVWLRLPGNPVSDVAPLGRLEKLRWLWLDSGTAAGMEALSSPAGRGAAQLWIERTPAQ